MPALYFFAKNDSRAMARMADENIAMGWLQQGQASITS